MRRRTALSTALVAVLLAGAASPSLAGPKPKPKPKPKPITGSYQATALTPDPTPFVGDICDPVLPTAMHEKEFTVPAAGSFHVETKNTLDWAILVRATDGERLGESDGGTPETKEAVDVTFKKKQKIVIRTCNFAGEPTVTVTYKFTFK